MTRKGRDEGFVAGGSSDLAKLKSLFYGAPTKLATPGGSR